MACELSCGRALTDAHSKTLPSPLSRSSFASKVHDVARGSLPIEKFNRGLQTLSQKTRRASDFTVERPYGHSCYRYYLALSCNSGCCSSFKKSPTSMASRFNFLYNVCREPNPRAALVRATLQSYCFSVSVITR